MNTHTQLKKGDICASPWGKVTIEAVDHSPIVLVITESGESRAIHTDELTRIPSFQERIQSVLDIAWDVENRLSDDETVQIKVGAFVEFARHYVAMRDALAREAQSMRNFAGMNIGCAELTEKLLKGETL